MECACRAEGQGSVSSNALVLVDDAPEDVLAADRPAVTVLRAWLGHGELQASVGPGPVVVAHITAKDGLELTT